MADHLIERRIGDVQSMMCHGHVPARVFEWTTGGADQHLDLMPAQPWHVDPVEVAGQLWVGNHANIERVDRVSDSAFGTERVVQGGRRTRQEGLLASTNTAGSVTGLPVWSKRSLAHS